MEVKLLMCILYWRYKIQLCILCLKHVQKVCYTALVINLSTSTTTKRNVRVSFQQDSTVILTKQLFFKLSKHTLCSRSITLKQRKCQKWASQRWSEWSKQANRSMDSTCAVLSKFIHNALLECSTSLKQILLQLWENEMISNIRLQRRLSKAHCPVIKWQIIWKWLKY